jgi:hypothetical protein
VRRDSGHYFTNSKKTPTKNKFDTEENRALLWDLSLKSIQEPTAAAIDQAG